LVAINKTRSETRLAAGVRAGVRLYCFPYAGGTASLYSGWSRLLPHSVEAIPIELPGRGKLIGEAPLRRVADLVDVLVERIASRSDAPFVLFGHSMGAIIAFEIARTLRRRRRPLPEHIFVSGRRAPQTPPTDELTYNLSEPDFIATLQRLNGTPKEVLEHSELMELMLPILRADFELVETYEYRDEAPLDCPITAFGGFEDTDVTRDLLKPWGDLTISRFELHMLPGDHFFVRYSNREMLNLMGQELAQITTLAHR
jgi:medium-chain acyl-[acyl-carrier-protein] hydrolase